MICQLKSNISGIQASLFLLVPFFQVILPLLSVKPQFTPVPHYLQYVFTTNSTTSVLVTILHIDISYLKGSVCDFQKKSTISLSIFASVDTNMCCHKALAFVLIKLLTCLKLTERSSPLSICHVKDL